MPRLDIGYQSNGKVISAEMADMAHLMIAGMTGSGKSVFLNALLLQLIQHPVHEVRLILFDPKRVELAAYRGAPHLLDDPVSDPGDMVYAMTWLENEMQQRFSMLEDFGVRSVDEWNMTAAPDLRLPRIILAIDELANVVLSSRKAGDLLGTFATMGRAAGIHLILATQRPSADILDGQLRANIPTRFAFAVMNRRESEIILGVGGAEMLPGRGRMLAMLPGDRVPRALMGAMVETDTIRKEVTKQRAQTPGSPGATSARA